MRVPHAIDFTIPASVEELAVCLGVGASLLSRVITVEDQSTLYVQHKIPKKRANGSGAVRIVWDIEDALLRDAHRAYARRFEAFARTRDARFPHPGAYGYVRGRGILDNARQHCGAQWLLRADIEDFFPSIDVDRITNRFVQLGLQKEAARILARFSTINGALGLGLNASPMLANLVCSDLDDKFQELCLERGCTYTRYADDIAISGAQDVPSSNDVEYLLNGEGFRLSKRKFRVTKNGQAHFVTGLSISDKAGPHVPRALKRKLRQELYYCRKFGIAGHLRGIDERLYQTNVNRIDGTVRFVASIESRYGEQLRKEWNDILAVDSVSASYEPRNDAPPQECTFYFDETDFKRDGQQFLGLGCVTTGQAHLLARAAELVLRTSKVDPFAAGRKEILNEKGLHFTDAHEELKGQYIALLPYMPFRGYIAFAALTDPTSYSGLYLRLLQSILPRRFKDLDGATLTLIFEQNSRVSRSQLESTVSSIYLELKERNDRRPISMPVVKIGTKQNDPSLSVPDFLLGVFSRYYGDDKAGKDIATRRFERLRDKFRHIVNIDSGDFYSRRHPFP